MHLYGRAVLYTNAPGQLVREMETTEKYNAGESKPDLMGDMGGAGR